MFVHVLYVVCIYAGGTEERPHGRVALQIKELNKKIVAKSDKILITTYE